VGNETRYWRNGECMVFDTSIFHSTYNHAETPRYVLLIRLWHPDLTEAEIKAFRFVFDFLNYASYDESILNAYEAYEVYGIGSGVSQQVDVPESIEAVSTQGLTRQQRRAQTRNQEKSKPTDEKVTRSMKGFQ
jgi:hypothetical protein